jgi:hypothetical protein
LPTEGTDLINILELVKQAFMLKRSINLRLQKVYMRHLLKTCSALSQCAVTLNILALPVAFIIPDGIISNK